MQELVDKRTEYIKVYEDGDHLVAEVSGGTVHYKDDYDDPLEQYKDIDPTILASSKPAWDWEVEKGRFKMLIKADTTIALKRANKWIGFRFDGFGYLDWATKNYEILATRAAVTPVVTFNKIRWENICPLVNLEYIYGNDGYKQNIEITQAARDWCVAHPPSSYGLDNDTSYLVGFSLCDWSSAPDATDNDNNPIDWDAAHDFIAGNIKFKHPIYDKIIAFLPLGTAYVGEEGMQMPGDEIPLRQRFIKVGSDYRVLYGAKVTDLNALAPGTITLDPTTTFQPDELAGSGFDTYASGDPTVIVPHTVGQQYLNFGAANYIRIDHGSPFPDNQVRCFLSFDFSALGPIKVNVATMSLYCYENSNNHTDSTRCYRMTREDAVEGPSMGYEGTDGINWWVYKLGHPWTSPGGDFTTSPTTYSSTNAVLAGNWLNFNVKQHCQDASDWYAGVFRWLLRYAVEGDGAWEETRYYSREYLTDPSLRPKLYLEYTPLRTGSIRKRQLINHPSIHAGIRSYL